jgi:hypothetical protein
VLLHIEFQVTSKLADAAMQLAHKFQFANGKYATDYPANIGPHMTNTDSTPLMDVTPAISLREAERGAQIGSGWDPHHHQPTDVYATFNDDDFRLGLNAAPIGCVIGADDDTKDGTAQVPKCNLRHRSCSSGRSPIV